MIRTVCVDGEYAEDSEHERQAQNQNHNDMKIMESPLTHSKILSTSAMSDAHTDWYADSTQKRNAPHGVNDTFLLL
ncbi:MAG: hypothetical protein ACI4WV_04270 [Eubacteriales bacterium]